MSLYEARVLHHRLRLEISPEARPRPGSAIRPRREGYLKCSSGLGKILRTFAGCGKPRRPGGHTSRPWSDPRDLTRPAPETRVPAPVVIAPTGTPGGAPHMRLHYLWIASAAALATAGARADSFPVVETTIDDIEAAYQAGTATPEDVVQAYLDRINKFDRTPSPQPINGGKVNQPLNAYMLVN